MASRIAPKLLARAYATATQKSVQVPIVLYGIDGRYATALYTAAAKKQALEAVENDLKQVATVLNKEKGLQDILLNPTLNREAKKKGVKEIFKAGKYSDLTQNLFQTLAENGRLNAALKIIDSYSQLMTAYRGEMPVIITSAKELETSNLNKLKESLNKSPLAKSHKLLFSNKVNPSILGGIVIEFGDKTIDLSVSSGLAKLNKLIPSKFVISDHNKRKPKLRLHWISFLTSTIDYAIQTMECKTSPCFSLALFNLTGWRRT
ncbi:ATP synthase delta subunit-domain-containing protein [Endogone sp. FLAS-F59071]|nr:ATP synthase delta subunit-domain-containing protein [Endogone sp. FLAS-F59071]|eukprot:RUS21354.1 ATP synthase delta subunit-domain-containing protein [Endogone sp. FLAS-F59071]